MNIRTATLQDIDQIAAVEKECFPAAEAATKEEFEQRLSHYGVCSANVIFFLTFLFIVSGTVIRNFIIYGCLFKIFFINVRPLCLSIVL